MTTLKVGARPPNARGQTGAKTKSPQELWDRRVKVAQLYLQCTPLHEIATQLKVSIITVYNDMCAVREQWRTKMTDNIDVLKQNELGRVDHLECEAWRGWVRSCMPRVITKSKTGTRPGDQGGPYDEDSTERQNQPGDPRFLAIVDKCVESRRKMLGLDAPVKAAVEGLDAIAKVLASRPATAPEDPEPASTDDRTEKSE